MLTFHVEHVADLGSLAKGHLPEDRAIRERRRVRSRVYLNIRPINGDPQVSIRTFHVKHFRRKA